MKRVVITGGTGFVGANLVRRLLSYGHELHLFVRPGHQGWRLADIQSDFRWHECALEHKDTLYPLLQKIRPDWVFHLAAHGAYSWQTDVSEIVQTNIIGTINLAQVSMELGVETFINTGSSSEYGLRRHAPSETEALDPNSFYAVTKASATLFCRHLAQSKGAHLCTLRLYSVFGPYEEPQRLIPALITCGLEGKLPPLVDPDAARDYVYIDDVCDAYCLAAEQGNQEPGGIYNVGTGRQIKLHEVVAVARDKMKIDIMPKWNTMPSRSWDTDKWVADNRKIQKTLGWQPRHTFEEGFEQTLRWYLDTPAVHQIYRRTVCRAA